MAKFRNGNLVLTSSQNISIGGTVAVDNTRAGTFSDIRLDANLATIIDEFSTDGTLVGDSDTALPTEQAVKTYVDNKISGSIASSVDNRLARYDGTDGIQGTGISIDDSDNMSGITNVNSTSFSIGNGVLSYPTSPAGSIYLDFKGTQGVREVMNDGSGNFNRYFNSYYDTSAAAHKFILAATGASRLAMSGGSSVWYVSNTSAGLAGDNITWVNAMSITADTGAITFGGSNVGITGTTRSAGKLYAGATDPISATRLNYDGEFHATKFHNAVWNDIADFQRVIDEVVPGKCYYDTLNGAKICNTRCQKSVIGILSDTYGIGVGTRGDDTHAPFAVAGWVLAYVADECEPGDPLTNDADGNLIKMGPSEKTAWPERIVAIYKKPEDQEYWGTLENKILVNGRHWVKVK